MCQRTQTEIGPNVTSSFACLCMHVPSFVRQCIRHLCFSLHAGAKISAIWTSLNPAFVCQSRNVALTVVISESNGRRSQFGRQLVLMGLVLVRAKGKDDLSLLFILGRQQEECRSSCSIPTGRSHPCEFQSATATTLPLLTQGAWMYPSTVQCK